MNWPCWKGLEQSSGSGFLMMGNLRPNPRGEEPQKGSMVHWCWLADINSSPLLPRTVGMSPAHCSSQEVWFSTFSLSYPFLSPGNLPLPVASPPSVSLEPLSFQVSDFFWPLVWASSYPWQGSLTLSGSRLLSD